MEIGIDGVRVGHWTDEVARTGCTVVLLPESTVASGEVRGGAPASREFALLDPLRTVSTIDAVVLAGGSAFGLAAADGVVRWCAEADRGLPTTGGRVPIVVGLGLYDLLEGDGTVRPDAAAGHAAASSATTEVRTGRIGAGTGATLGKWRGREHARPGGLGVAAHRAGDVHVAAMIAVNAVGDIDDGTLLTDVRSGSFELPAVDPLGAAPEATNTTIGVVVTDAALTKIECHEVARVGHGAFARALVPAHTAADGDALVVAATGRVEAPVGLVRLLAQAAVEDAIRAVADI